MIRNNFDLAVHLRSRLLTYLCILASRLVILPVNCLVSIYYIVIVA